MEGRRGRDRERGRGRRERNGKQRKNAVEENHSFLLNKVEKLKKQEKGKETEKRLRRRESWARGREETGKGKLVVGKTENLRQEMMVWKERGKR